MKKILLLLALGLVVMFILGFFVGRLVYHQPSKELCIGIPIPHNPGAFQFDQEMCVTNLDSETELTMDNIRLFIATAPSIENTVAPSELPNYMIQLRSTKMGVFFLMAQVWITDSGAIIGNWDYELNTIKDAQQLSKDSTNYLVEFIEGIQSN